MNKFKLAVQRPQDIYPGQSDVFYDPFKMLPSIIPSTFFDSIEKMFSGLDFYNPESRSWSLTKGFPKGDMIVNDEEATIELALAGYSKEQLSVKVEGNMLSVSANKCQDSDEEEGRTLARRAFKQQLSFDKEYNIENTKVTYKDGLLKIVVPKFKKEEKVCKEIEII